MSTILIDGCAIAFKPGDNILRAALEADVEIPHFCYHAALDSLGACRLCAVEIKPKNSNEAPRLTMACLEPAKEGLEVSVSAAAAQQVRRHVIELLMINHPHDCPICDEGGECHLQEMTVTCGPPYRRYRGRKRTFTNQDLGPLIHHEMNRCITCYRCTRFYQDYALGNDLGAMRLRNEVYFGRFQDGPLESPFAGNLVEICPTGVFTDALFRQRFARAWDLNTAPSICPHCSVGCNTLPGARDGTLRRVRSRAHPELNRWFICDRGRYGHQYSEHCARLLSPRVSGENTSYHKALNAATTRIKTTQNCIGGIGSAREDLEGNTMLQALLNEVGGVFTAFNDPALEAATIAAVSWLQNSAGAPSLIEMEQIDAALIIGDLTAHAPMIDLALRQAYRKGAELTLFHSSPTPLAQFTTSAITVPPREMYAKLSHLCTLINALLAGRDISDDPMAVIAKSLIKARQPLLIGTIETLTATDASVLAKLAIALGPNARLTYALSGPNAYGSALLAPEGNAMQILESVETGKIKTLIVAGNDPFSDPRFGLRWRAACRNLNTLIVLDCILTATAEAADILFPVAAWTERGGTFVNYEGRAQSFLPVFHRPEYLPSAADVIADLAKYLECSQQDVLSVLQDTFPDFQVPAPGTLGSPIPVSLPPISDSPSAGSPLLSSNNSTWQTALMSWYGDETLASFAPGLTSLAPTTIAMIEQATATATGIVDGSKIRLRGSADSVVLPVQLNQNIAAGTVGIGRNVLVRLGLGHGDPIELEKVS
ncbi:NADH dehydrogenase subunit G [Nitrosomonas aestuarii]|uniref:NADH-quinone oxidoreductase n=1 Tax=Nitrosomonas aestuarii TaxID=52441 RepID=A0A1I4AH50_9PROT|nr:NADH-quinone oxidoreductase subunit NuoG [Nitrosomonas aestuarii]SFK55714.1 NADH dehydrogenase subunit G [Nitrosomonas aestuarii]